MAKRIKDGGQRSFKDTPLMDAELATACEMIMDTAEATSDNARAKQVLKERLPAITEPTRFIIGERYFIECVPYEADDIEVPGGTRIRKRVLNATSD